MTSLDELRADAADCRRCPLWECGTQTVFGAGAPDADVMLVGEQPGDQEDKAGEPFVGPAGKVLDRALEAAGIDRERAFVTNAVKHFKWRPAGKRRIHQKPNASEMKACKPWLEAEVAVVRPRLLVCLGATAAQAVLGRGFRLTQHRGELVDASLPDPAPLVTATIHPSVVLRARDSDDRHAQFDGLVHDLRVAAEAVAAGNGPAGGDAR